MNSPHFDIEKFTSPKDLDLQGFDEFEEFLSETEYNDFSYNSRSEYRISKAVDILVSLYKSHPDLRDNITNFLLAHPSRVILLFKFTFKALIDESEKIYSIFLFLLEKVDPRVAASFAFEIPERDINIPLIRQCCDRLLEKGLVAETSEIIINICHLQPDVGYEYFTRIIKLDTKSALAIANCLLVSSDTHAEKCMQLFVQNGNMYSALSLANTLSVKSLSLFKKCLPLIENDEKAMHTTLYKLIVNIYDRITYKRNQALISGMNIEIGLNGNDFKYLIDLVLKYFKNTVEKNSFIIRLLSINKDLNIPENLDDNYSFLKQYVLFENMDSPVADPFKSIFDELLKVPMSKQQQSLIYYIFRTGDLDSINLLDTAAKSFRNDVSRQKLARTLSVIKYLLSIKKDQVQTAVLRVLGNLDPLNDRHARVFLFLSNELISLNIFPKELSHFLQMKNGFQKYYPFLLTILNTYPSDFKQILLTIVKCGLELNQDTLDKLFEIKRRVGAVTEKIFFLVDNSDDPNETMNELRTLKQNLYSHDMSMSAIPEIYRGYLIDLSMAAFQPKDLTEVDLADLFKKHPDSKALDGLNIPIVEGDVPEIQMDLEDRVLSEMSRDVVDFVYGSERYLQDAGIVSEILKVDQSYLINLFRSNEQDPKVLSDLIKNLTENLKDQTTNKQERIALGKYRSQLVLLFLKSIGVIPKSPPEDKGDMNSIYNHLSNIISELDHQKSEVQRYFQHGINTLFDINKVRADLNKFTLRVNAYATVPVKAHISGTKIAYLGRYSQEICTVDNWFELADSELGVFHINLVSEDQVIGSCIGLLQEDPDDEDKKILILRQFMANGAKSRRLVTTACADLMIETGRQLYLKNTDMISRFVIPEQDYWHQLTNDNEIIGNYLERTYFDGRELVEMDIKVSMDHYADKFVTILP
jgi:hypothetical protein